VQALLKKAVLIAGGQIKDKFLYAASMPVSGAQA
jgi:hypothetical protein